MTSLLRRTMWFVGKNVRKIIICIKKGFDIRLALLCDIDLESVPENTILGHPFGIVMKDKNVVGLNY